MHLQHAVYGDLDDEVEKQGISLFIVAGTRRFVGASCAGNEFRPGGIEHALAVRAIFGRR